MIEIRDLVLHPIQLIEVELVSCNLSKNIKFNEETLKSNMDISLKSWAEIDEENKQIGYTFLNLNIDFEEKEKPFVINMTYRGKCKIEEINFSDEQFNKFLETQGLKLLWPYIKPALSDFMVKMDLIPLRLPTLDVLKTMEKGNVSERK